MEENTEEIREENTEEIGEKTEEPKIIETETENFRIRRLPLTDKDKYIFGKLYLPKESQKTFPTVILAHGYGVNHLALADVAEILAENGIAAYAFDFCGGGIASRSSGTMMEMSVETELSDLEFVMKSIYDMGFADKSRFYLCGESQGGFVAAWCGARNPHMTTGLILMYPALNLPKYGKDRFPEGSEIPDKVLTLGMMVGSGYYKALRKVDISAECEKYPGPVLILHGEKDDMVPVSFSEDALDLFPDARLVILENAGHGFYNEEVSVAAQQIIAFINEG